MNQRGFNVVGIIVGIAVLVVVGFGVWYWQETKIEDLQAQVNELQEQTEQQQNQDGAQTDAQDFQYTSEKGVSMEVYVPKEGSQVESPIGVIGRVPGNWSFEASFPIEVRAGGEVIGQGTAQLTDDWMTEELVPFTSEIELDSQPAGEATLVLRKDNPSDLPENDDSVSIPIELGASQAN